MVDDEWMRKSRHVEKGDFGYLFWRPFGIDASPIEGSLQSVDIQDEVQLEQLKSNCIQDCVLVRGDGHDFRFIDLVFPFAVDNDVGDAMVEVYTLRFDG